MRRKATFDRWMRFVFIVVAGIFFTFIHPVIDRNVAIDFCRKQYWSTVAAFSGIVVTAESIQRESVFTIQTADSLFEHRTFSRDLLEVVRPGDSIYKSSGTLMCTLAWNRNDSIWYDAIFCDSSEIR